ncbi:MAG: 2,3-bisphosphoglycerate-independent phosphoglycerate mutase, partial [Candidatus Komeilibacteria bacterium]|nr:2,3-bisphosphoglycerate-independent phosphoglycerate mutase [Candidatus Komeilibacteria bacterium]
MAKPLINGPVVLVILDGFGIAPEGRPSNPISRKFLPEYNRLCSEGRYTRLWAHGEYVGLPKDQDGNSEAGHLNLGAGRVVKQDPIIINESINDGTFLKNPAFHDAIRHARQNNSRLHLIGMISDGQSAHSTPDHLYTLLDLLDKEKVSSVFLHLFTDGRDSSPFLGKLMVENLIKHLHPNQQIASIIGRFYAMDRRKSWDRTEKAYNAIVLGEGTCVNDPLDVFIESYREGIGDEFIEPHSICHAGQPIGDILDNDAIIFFNHRSDRARQLAKPFVQKDFAKANPGSFTPKRVIKNLCFVAMTDFGPDLDDIITAYPSVLLKDTLPMVLSKKRQLYLAESEKYAHMTYFFNGGYADPVNGEERMMIPSPNVTRYDQTPGMATKELTDVVVKSLAG